jgi:hypothetical protein
MNDIELSAFFSKLPENEQAIALKLYEIIQSHEVSFECRLSYQSLFFFLKKKRLFYLWPASIPWGGINEGLRLAFIHGYLFHDDIRRHLSFNDRKEIGVIDFTQLEKIDAALIFTLLTEATQMV